MPLCKHCHRPIKYDAVANLSAFDKMHWLCWHFTMVHFPTDPDDACKDPDCPIKAVEDMHKLGDIHKLNMK
jgi:hypothetical protein